MPDEPSDNLPAPIASALSNIAQALMPNSLKALNRLVGVGIEIPVAWLERQKAKIEARTRSMIGVEEAVGRSAADQASTDAEITERAVEALISRSYRKQENMKRIGTAMLVELSAHDQGGDPASAATTSEIDDDWLNVFERYAEDASSERMQKLWGRVLAGEVRQPGRYALRTLRFLSEFSQQDALNFAHLGTIAFDDFIPKKLAQPEDESDITALLALEAAGVITGASGLGLQKAVVLNSNGNGFLAEGKLLVQMQGEAASRLKFKVIILTPLGKELLSLLPDRVPLDAARRVANALRGPEIKRCFLGVLSADGDTATGLEMLWNDDNPASAG